MKQCAHCKEIKPKTEFVKHSQKADGLNSWCKTCKRAKDKTYMEKRKHLKAAYDKEYSQLHKEKITNRGKLYRESHKEEKAKYDKAYRENQGCIRLQKKRDYYHNGGKLTQYKWIKENPEKVRAYSSTMSAARRKVVTAGASSAQIAVWLSDQVKICSYCGTFCANDYQIDHIEPLAKGGTHTIDNFAISCKSCNTSKSSKQLLHWLAFKQQLIEVADKKP